MVNYEIGINVCLFTCTNRITYYSKINSPMDNFLNTENRKWHQVYFWYSSIVQCKLFWWNNLCPFKYQTMSKLLYLYPSQLSAPIQSIVIQTVINNKLFCDPTKSLIFPLESHYKSFVNSLLVPRIPCIAN